MLCFIIFTVNFGCVNQSRLRKIYLTNMDAKDLIFDNMIYENKPSQFQITLLSLD